MITSYEIPNANKAVRSRGHLEHHSNATLSFILQCKMFYFGKHINLSVCYSHIWFRSIEESTFWCLRMLHVNTSFVSKTWHQRRREQKGNMGTSNAVIITRDKQQHILSAVDSTVFRSGRPSLSTVLLSIGYIILGKLSHFSESLFLLCEVGRIACLPWRRYEDLSIHGYEALVNWKHFKMMKCDNMWMHWC